MHWAGVEDFTHLHMFIGTVSCLDTLFTFISGLVSASSTEDFIFSFDIHSLHELGLTVGNGGFVCSFLSKPFICIQKI